MRAAVVSVALALGACASSREDAPEPDAVAEGTQGNADSVAPAVVASPEPAAPPWKPRPEDELAPHQPLEDPGFLAPFYDALARADDGEGIVRVVHLGASMIGMDDLTGVLRENFQTRFGDGGAGLVLMARYMSNYMHRWVKLRASGWNNCYIIYGCKKDGHYGLGGTTFSSNRGATTAISTLDEGLGSSVSRFELWYAATPGGSTLEVRVDRDEPVRIDTKADALEDRWHEIDVEPGGHEIRVRAVGNGHARAYGVLLETDGPGIVWDQFSMLGAFTKRMMNWDAEHIARQVAHRDPDLIAFTYGGNDVRRVANRGLSVADYRAEFVQVIEHVRAGKPEVACLVIGMTDRGKSLKFDIYPKHVETIVQGQREAAQEAGCAFFDTYTAMGGGGSLKKWKRMDPPLAAPDLKHLTHRGRVKLGRWIYEAVIAGYVEHRRKLTASR